jgi:hypothetical protein
MSATGKPKVEEDSKNNKMEESVVGSEEKDNSFVDLIVS